MTDIVIVGGGVIGLSIAWELSGRGAQVTVLDAGLPGQASWAAAGMLAPLAESSLPGAPVEVGLASLREYPTFLAALREATGSDLDQCGPGMLRIAFTEAEEEALCRALTWQRSLGLPLEWLDRADVRRAEPAVTADVRAAVLSPMEKHVNPRRLVPLLRQGCERRGVRLQSGVTVQGFERTGAEVTSVQTSEGRFHCGSVLVSGGAWSREIGDWLGATFPVTPVRGQVLSLRQSPPNRLHHTLYGHTRYLVPRTEGQVVVGATMEHAGFDVHNTAGGVSTLLEAALACIPALAEAPLEETWTGLRPVSADGLPLLGRVPGWDNAFVATGHGRNGILLSPFTGRLMAEFVVNGTPPPPAFDPARFVTTS